MRDAEHLTILADALFDGIDHHAAGPYLVTVDGGTVTAVEPAPPGTAAHLRVPFLMPSLVEAHAHIFLDGGELDGAARAAYLKAEPAAMMAVGRANLARYAAAGVTLVRDAGDRYGINHALRVEQTANPLALVTLRSPGLGVKRPKRYGGFMAADILPEDDVAEAARRHTEGCDDLKIILTGIVDFENAEVKGVPQFDAEALAAIVADAHARGLRTFVHCSGAAGLAVAVEARVDSIEHGYFISRPILERMADAGIAWVPTFSPVHFQGARPDLAGWSPQVVDNIKRILDAHSAHVAIAHALGVELVAGSDAGSQGVVHGAALLDELDHFLNAGLPMAAVLRTATERPRRLWGVTAAGPRAGATADLLALAASPFSDRSALRRPLALVRACSPHRTALTLLGDVPDKPTVPGAVIAGMDIPGSNSISATAQAGADWGP